MLASVGGFAHRDELRHTDVVKIVGAAARVARRLLEGGPAAASTLGADLGLTAAAVRRHLDALEDAGFVTAHDKAPFGPRTNAPRGRGRPAKVYALTAEGRDAFDQAYDDVALGALRFMGAQGGPSLVQGYADARIAGSERRYAEALADIGPDLELRAQALAELLAADGYAASIRVVPGGAIQICQHNCPMSHVAAEFPEFCEAENAALGRLLGVRTVRISTIATGADLCTTHVPGGVLA